MKVSHLKTLNVLIVWIAFVIFIALFLSLFPARFPFFKIKQITVEGNETVDFKVIESVLQELTLNVERVNEENVMKYLNARTGNRIRSVKIRKKYTLEGIEVNIAIEERKPVARVSLGKSILLVDEDGEVFKPAKNENIKDLPIILTYDVSLLKYFGKLYKELKLRNITWKLVKITADRTEVITDKYILIFPKIDEITESAYNRLNLVYNFQGKVVDLRFERFILVREKGRNENGSEP